MELTLAQLFGEGAFQDGDRIIIQKSSLSGLTPHANNTPGSLLAAILITALDNFQGIITEENSYPITDENSYPITFDNSEAFELLKIISWKPFQVKRVSSPYIINQLIVFIYAN